MESWICYKCVGYTVFETMLVRINRLACILDTYEDLRELEDEKDVVRIAMSMLS